jgi:O-antigen/teichoic acid export membrane protein
MRLWTRNSGEISGIFRRLSGGVNAADRRRIFRGTFHSFLIQAISVALVFASNLWLVRSSDPDAYGLYVHVFNWVSILAVFVVAGRDDLVLALIPKYVREGKNRLVARLIRACNRWLVLATLVVTGVFLAIIGLFPVRALSENIRLFLLSIPAVYLTACLGINQMILQSLDHIRQSQIVERIAKPLLLIFFVGVFHLAATSFNGKDLILLSTIVLGISGAAVLVLTGQKMRRLAATPEPTPRLTIDTRQVFYFFSVSLLNLLSTRLTMLLLPYFTVAAKDVGIFNICSRFADLLIFPFFLMHSVLPQLFARHTPEEKTYTQGLFDTSNRLMLLLCVPLLLGIVLLGKFMLSWFGQPYTDGYATLVYLSLAQLLFSLFGPSNTILMTQGLEKYSAICLLAYVLILAISSCILLPLAGMTGGALAVLVSSLCYNILLAVVCYRTTGVYSPFFRLRRRQVRRP